MIQKDYDYVQGTAARQVQYDVYEENKVLKAKRRYKNNRKVKLKMVLSILVVLGGGLLLMQRYAAITQLSYDMNKIEEKYNVLRNENALLRVQIETNTNLTEVKELAESKLNMKMPDKSQTIYIKVPRNDYTVVLNSEKETEDSGNIFRVILGKLAALVKLLE